MVYYWFLDGVKWQKDPPTNRKPHHYTTALQGYLVGFGLVIPTILFLFYYAIDSFDICNLGC